MTFVVIGLYVLLDRFSTPKLEQSADEERFKEKATINAIRIARLITGFIGVLILTSISGIGFASILRFAGTTLTLLGVALFAQWSIPTNITAYFILLLHRSFRRDDFVRVIDVDTMLKAIFLISTYLARR